MQLGFFFELLREQYNDPFFRYLHLNNKGFQRIVVHEDECGGKAAAGLSPLLGSRPGALLPFLSCDVTECAIPRIPE